MLGSGSKVAQAVLRAQCALRRTADRRAIAVRRDALPLRFGPLGRIPRIRQGFAIRPVF